MKAAHKDTKSGLVRFSGGRKGKLQEMEYQKLFLDHQMSNSLPIMKSREENPLVAANKKFKRKCNENDRELSSNN